MIISRRGFLRYCSRSAAVLGMTASDLGRLQRALANPSAPLILWLQGAACSGCSASFLNFVSPSPPVDADDFLVANVNLAYHSLLMGAAGDLATGVVQSAIGSGNYILAVEGGIPTSFSGNACVVWSDSSGNPVSCRDAVLQLAAKASRILCIGTCASFGGVPGTAPNPAGVQSVAQITQKPTIHIAGCPPHPNWIIWGITNALSGTIGSLDAYGRPVSVYNTWMHASCPRSPTSARGSTYGMDGVCVMPVGCRGPVKYTYAPCAAMKWNNNVNWCTDANTVCVGCVNPDFPGTAALRKPTTGAVTGLPSVICLNAGGSQYVDLQGVTWKWDYGFEGGGTSSTTTPIAGTPSPGVYQTERWGPPNDALVYVLPIGNGNYSVTLKFAEINPAVQPGQRVFHVSINGQTVLSNFDIVAAAGGAFIPCDRTFPVRVDSGTVLIVFTPVAGNPKISGIQVI